MCARQRQHYITRCNWHDNAIGIIFSFHPAFDIVNYMISNLTWRFYSLCLFVLFFFYSLYIISLLSFAALNPHRSSLFSLLRSSFFLYICVYRLTMAQTLIIIYYYNIRRVRYTYTDNILYKIKFIPFQKFFASARVRDFPMRNANDIAGDHLHAV